MQICSQRTNDYNSSVTEDEINSAVRKAGSFEGTLPRCFSVRSCWEQAFSKPTRFSHPRHKIQIRNFKIGDSGGLFRFFRLV